PYGRAVRAGAATGAGGAMSAISPYLLSSSARPQAASAGVRSQSSAIPAEVAPSEQIGTVMISEAPHRAAMFHASSVNSAVYLFWPNWVESYTVFRVMMSSTM